LPSLRLGYDAAPVRTPPGGARDRSSDVRRIGIYDTFDKWQILCRYWHDPDTAKTVGSDRFDLPLVPRWHQIAEAHGRRFGLEYLQARMAVPRPQPPRDAASGLPAGLGPAIEAEIAGSAARLGLAELQGRYSRLVDAITTNGFDAPFDGLPAPLADRLRQAFKRGALEALQWTEDDAEVPSLPVLRYWAPVFPAAALRNRADVLCVFSCRFYGRADVIHVHDAGPDAVTLVDSDRPTMADMKLIYPADWRYIISDYREFLAEAARAGRSYDVIVADPWLTMAQEVAWDVLPEFLAICSDTFITNYSTEMLAELGVQPDDLGGLTRAIGRRTGADVAVVQCLVRNSAVAWVVMRKTPA
jgi:hypothetical protein